MHPPVVRERDGGFTQYWTGGGEVRGRDVTEAMESGREEVVEGNPLKTPIYLSADGTGIPMRGEEVGGVAGKGPERDRRFAEVRADTGTGGEGGPGTGRLPPPLPEQHRADAVRRMPPPGHPG